MKIGKPTLIALLSLALTGCGLFFGGHPESPGNTEPPTPPSGFDWTQTQNLRQDSIAASGAVVGTFSKNVNSHGIGDFTYTLYSPSSSSYFEVSGGQLKTKTGSIPANTYTLTVRARDEGGKYVDRDIAITVKPAFGIQSAVIAAATLNKLDVIFTESVKMTTITGFTLGGGNLGTTLSSAAAVSPDADGYAAAWLFALSGNATGTVSTATISYDNTNGTVYIKDEVPKAPDMAGKPIFNNVTALTADTWADGSISAASENWYEITATSTGNYYLWLNQNGIGYGDGSKTGRVYHTVYDSSASSIASESSSAYYSSGRSFPVTSGQKYYVKLTKYTPGTYAIAFSTTNSRP